ncbi:class I SAM-dependent methyltransferase [Halorussus marinus]|uniref:class I SAM-dependent methyltransferase n=1 Tax=Halorussus marinus TaxID=2505976 RepID=UPI00106E46B5|nr:class I SAM-dependent methyltransferase [Halorussus marinus]
MTDERDAAAESSDHGPFHTERAVDLYADRMADAALFSQERTAVERYFTEPGGSVLDVGCGAGRVASLLADRGFDATGVDVSRPLVADASDRRPDLDFQLADVRTLPFESATFDYAVFSFYGLDYVLPRAERLAALRELYRVLNPAGVLVFSSHNSWHPFVPLSGRDLLQALKDVWDLYLRPKNRDRLLSRYKVESVPLGEVEIYLSNPIHQWLQLRKCGFTPLDVVGRHDDVRRFFERDPHYVAKK